MARTNGPKARKIRVKRTYATNIHPQSCTKSQKDGDGVSKTNESPRSRARAYEAFYDPAIENDADAATDYALSKTGGSAKYRGVWRFYCLQIGINTFLHQLYVVLSSYRQGELRYPARAFHARIRNMKTKLDEVKGAMK